MRYLKASLHESQRVKPAISALKRETTQDTVLGSCQRTVVTYCNLLKKLYTDTRGDVSDWYQV